MKPTAVNEHQVSVFGVLIPRAALISALCYLAIALPFAGKIPLVELVMFSFHVPDGKTTFPLFLANGEVAHIEDYNRFLNLPPEVVDLEHGGYECSVEHKFHEAKRWLTKHQAPNSESPGPVTVEIGMGILFIDENNALHQEHQINGTGTAHPRAKQ